MANETNTLYDLLYYCQEGQRVAIVGSRQDEDEVRNGLYVSQPQDEAVQEFISTEHDDGRLLVITGSAGDGKSALLERATRMADGEVIPDKRVNMDATSAVQADEDYDERLIGFFDRIIDDVINKSGPRSAVAINYGLAVDFFRLREHGDPDTGAFSDIWEAIKQSEQPDYQTDSNIEVINLSNRRTYKTNPEQIGGGLLREIVNRFDPTYDKSPFTRAFEYEEEHCPAGERCPLHYNVKQLTKEETKDRLAEYFASWSIVKGAYLNPRMIIDRIARTLLPTGVRELPDHDVCPVGAAVDQGTYSVTVDDLLWNAAFAALSTTDEEASFVDPASRTGFKLDQEILSWNASQQELDDALGESGFSFGDSRKKIRTVLRKRYLTGHSTSFLATNEAFNEYVGALTYYGPQESKMTADLRDSVKSFNAIIEEALENWTGRETKGNLVEFRDTRRSTDYQFLSERTPPNVQTGPSQDASRTISLPGRIKLKVAPKHEVGNTIPIPLSFPLYKLMRLISDGYVPNSADMNQSHSIQMLQTKISALTQKESFVKIQNISADRSVTLDHDEDLGITVTSEGFE